MHHPHVHCIVTGGGLSLDQSTWVPAKADYFLPVKVMSRLFRGKFLHAMKQAHLLHPLHGVDRDREFQTILDPLYRKEWVVYCKPPFQSPENVLEYLGRYTHKVAISNQRILQLEDSKVSFQWRDYKDDNRNKIMMLDVFEFIRRFLLHILPDRFVKIRHYGLLANRNRETKLHCCKELLHERSMPSSNPKKKESWSELLMRITGVDPTCCPICRKGHMITRHTLNPVRMLPAHQSVAA